MTPDTAPALDVTAWLDELERLRAAATDYASLTTDEGARAFEQARYEAVHDALPRLTAAVRAVERLIQTAPTLRFANDYPVNAVPVAQLLDALALTAALASERTTP